MSKMVMDAIEKTQTLRSLAVLKNVSEYIIYDENYSKNIDKLDKLIGNIEKDKFDKVLE